MSINGSEYAKGLGVHSYSSVEFNLDGRFSRFETFIGVDDEVGSNGSVLFIIVADNWPLVYRPVGPAGRGDTLENKKPGPATELGGRWPWLLVAVKGQMNQSRKASCSSWMCCMIQRFMSRSMSG